jgi:hypothetical protein
MMEEIVPLQRRLLQEPYGVTSQKAEFFKGNACSHVCEECYQRFQLIFIRHHISPEYSSIDHFTQLSATPDISIICRSWLSSVQRIVIDTRMANIKTLDCVFFFISTLPLVSSSIRNVSEADLCSSKHDFYGRTFCSPHFQTWRTNNLYEQINSWRM